MAHDYKEMARVAVANKEWDEADGYYREALNIWVQRDNEKQTATIYHAMGNMESDREKCEPAANYYLQAAIIREKPGRKVGTAHSRYRCAYCLEMDSKFSDAKKN
ncbi:MAG: tetratricopeptide repeat protein [bacterium]|nr:tetratricopeptide repeat protein [bacterium]